VKEQRAQQLAEAGERIRKLRIASKLTQTVVALKLEVPYQVLQRYEQGKAAIPSDRLALLADILGVAMDDLSPQPSKKTKKPRPFEQVLSPEEMKLIDGFRRLNDRRTRASLLQILEQLAPGSA